MKAKTKQELLDLYHKTHGSYYDYSELDLDNKINGKVKIICPVHGEFLQHHYDHISAGCPQCGKKKVKQKLSKILVNGVDDLISQLGHKFDFSKSVFKNTNSRLLVWCKEHQQFFQNSTYHIIRGAGCPECKKAKISSKKRLSKSEFIDRAIKKHGTKYDYSLVEYKTLTDSVKIICSEHGVFEQKPRDHISGCGCQLCGSTTVSKVSQKWLQSLNVPVITEHKVYHDTGYYVVDGYNPNTNTIYEFYGDYWHGNPKTFKTEDINPSVDKKFGDLYNETILREQVLNSLGYNLVTIWESDFYASSSGQSVNQTEPQTTSVRPV
jgi:Zn finger protein HypA/HybF involved in hydrogenase expression